jgi:hypothetical protein
MMLLETCQNMAEACHFLRAYPMLLVSGYWSLKMHRFAHAFRYWLLAAGQSRCKPAVSGTSSGAGGGFR